MLFSLCCRLAQDIPIFYRSDILLIHVFFTIDVSILHNKIYIYISVVVHSLTNNKSLNFEKRKITVSVFCQFILKSKYFRLKTKMSVPFAKTKDADRIWMSRTHNVNDSAKPKFHTKVHRPQ